jgi:hypothetical protein
MIVRKKSIPAIPVKREKRNSASKVGLPNALPFNKLMAREAIRIRGVMIFNMVQE